MTRFPIAESYQEAVLIMALLRIVDSKSLNLLFRSQVARSKFVKKATARGHIQRLRISETNRRGERKQQQYYAISSEGIAFLAAKEIPLYEIAIAQSDMVLFNNRDNHNYARTRAAAVTTAIIHTYAAGAAIPAATFGAMKDDDDRGSLAINEEQQEESRKNLAYSLKDFYRDYITDDDDLRTIAFSRAPDPGDEDYMVFHDRGLVKQILAMDSVSGNIKDFNAGRYAGILDSKKKSLMLFVAPRFVMSWARWIVNSDLNAYRMWGRTNAITSLQQQQENQTMAVVIVDNAHNFAYHYNTSRAGKEKNEVFGGMFAHVYIVPNDAIGVKFLNWLSLSNAKEIIGSMTSFALRSGEYQRNNSRSAALFPLQDRMNRETAICLTFDAKQINEIIYHANEHNDQQFQVLCIDWQEDYFRRVMPENISFRTFPMTIIAE